MAANARFPFTTQTTVTIPGATHGLGTAALLVEVYDAAVPAVRLQPGQLTIHPSTFDVTATFLQAQSGAVVLNAGLPAPGLTGNYAQTFTVAAETPLTIPGTLHQLDTPNLLVAVYDAQTPRRELRPGRVTVSLTTYDVVLTFAQAQSGLVVLCGHTSTGGTANVASALTAQTSLTIPGTTHGLGTSRLVVQVYDGSTPRRRVTPGQVTVHPTSYDVTVSFAQAQTGTVVLNGSALAHRFVASPSGLSVTPAVLVLVLRQVMGHPVASSSTPAIAIQMAGLIPLMAHPQGASTTPAALIQTVRQLTSQPQVGSVTPAVLSRMLRSLQAAVVGQSITPAIAIQLPGLVSLTAAPIALSTTPAAVTTVVRQLVAHPQVSSLTPAASASMGTQRLVVAHPQGSSTTPAAQMRTVRLLAAHPQGTSSTPAAGRAVGRALTAHAQGSSSTPAVPALLTRRLVAHPQSVSTTANATGVVAALRALVAHPQVISSTSLVPRPQVVRQCTAAVVGSSVTPVAGATVLRPLQAAPVVSSATSTATALVTTLRPLQAHPQAHSTTPAASCHLTRMLTAQVQSTTSTPGAHVTMVRLLSAHPQGASATPDLPGGLVRVLTSAPTVSSVTPDVQHALTRGLTSQVQAVSQTSGARVVTERLLAVHVQGTSVTPLALLIPFSGQFQLVASVQGTSQTPDAEAILLSMPRVTEVPAADVRVTEVPAVDVRVTQVFPLPTTGVSGSQETPHLSPRLARVA